MKASTVIWLVGLAFGFLETNYFGWNFAPASVYELICDGISLVIFSLAFVASAIEKSAP